MPRTPDHIIGKRAARSPQTQFVKDCSRGQETCCALQLSSPARGGSWHDARETSGTGRWHSAGLGLRHTNMIQHESGSIPRHAISLRGLSWSMEEVKYV